MENVYNKNNAAKFAHTCSCKSCSKKIKKAMQKIQGVESVEIVDGTTVVARGTFDADVLKQKVFKKTRKNLMVLSVLPAVRAPETVDVIDVDEEAAAAAMLAAKRAFKADEVEQKVMINKRTYEGVIAPVQKQTVEVSKVVVGRRVVEEEKKQRVLAAGSKGEMTAESNRDARRKVAVFEISHDENTSSDVIARITSRILRIQGVRAVQFDRKSMNMSMTVKGTFDIGGIMDYLQERVGNCFQLMKLDLEEEPMDKAEKAQATNLGCFRPAYRFGFLHRLIATLLGLVELKDLNLE